MPNIVIDIASEFTGKKGFDQAGKSTSKLESGIKGLGKQVAIAFSAAAIIDFGKAAVKAFADDEKSAAILANTMKNLGLEFQNPAVEAFISKLSAATGEVDDNLRPAMQKLLQVTGSVTQSQDLLKLALDVAAGSGQSLDTVVSDLAGAMSGNTKGIKKYALGLTAAELKTMSFESITAKLGSTFEGSAAKAAETFSGQLKILTTAAGEAQETIGKGLVDAFNILSSGSGGMTTVGEKLGQLAENVSNIIVGFAIFIDKLKSIPGVGKGVELFFGHLKDIFVLLNPLLKPIIDLLTYFGELGKTKTGTFQVGMSVTGATDYYKNQEDAIAKAEKEALARRLKAEKAAADAKIKADKKAAAAKAKLTKAESMFDIERIGLNAALKGKISKEEEVRLKLLLAIKDEDAAAADTLTKQLDTLQKKNEELAKALTSLPDANNPFAGWTTTLAAVSAQLAAINNVQIGTKMFEIRQKESGFTPPTPVEIVKTPDVPSIFTATDTAEQIAEKTANAAASAAAAATTAAEGVKETQKTVDMLAEAATNNAPASGSSMFNPTGYSSNVAGYGVAYPSTNVYLNVEGNMLSTEEYVKALTQALAEGTQNGYNIYRPGAVPAGG